MADKEIFQFLSRDAHSHFFYILFNSISPIFFCFCHNLLCVREEVSAEVSLAVITINVGLIEDEEEYEN